MNTSKHQDIQLRNMQHADINAVCAIEQQVQLHPWTSSQFADSVDRYQATVIEHHDEILGFCIMQKVLDEANLLLMAIAPKYQGNGFGAKILNDAITRLGSKCLQVFLEVRQSNHTAIALYEKVGFHQIDLRKNYYPAPNQQREHAVIMVNMLNEDAFSFQK